MIADSPIAMQREGAAKNLEYVNYLLRSSEVWARSYSQWIAERSGHRGMLDRIEASAKLTLPDQWTRDEFKPIAAAIDGIFRKLGLLRE